MNVLAAVVLVVKDASPRRDAPLLDRLARQKSDLRRDKVVVEKISRRPPRARAFRADEMNQEVWYPEKQKDERLRPRMAQARANPFAWEFVE